MNCVYSLANYYQISHESGEVNKIVWIFVDTIHNLYLFLAMCYNGWCALSYQIDYLLYTLYMCLL